MKKLRTLSVLLLVIAMVVSIAACSSGGLRGTYESKGLIAQSFTFDSGNKITMSAFGINASGTYKISSDKLTITYSIFGMEQNWSCSFEQKGHSIFIDGTEFVKR